MELHHRIPIGSVEDSVAFRIAADRYGFDINDPRWIIPLTPDQHRREWNHSRYSEFAEELATELDERLISGEIADGDQLMAEIETMFSRLQQRVSQDLETYGYLP